MSLCFHAGLHQSWTLTSSSCCAKTFLAARGSLHAKIWLESREPWTFVFNFRAVHPTGSEEMWPKKPLVEVGGIRLGRWWGGMDSLTLAFTAYEMFNPWMGRMRSTPDLWQVMIYTAGFPCQPYSMLSSTRLMLDDHNAAQLWAVIRNIRDTRPMEPCQTNSDTSQHVSITASFLLTDIECHILEQIMETKMALLENVLGFRSVLDVVVAIIRRNVPGFLCSIFQYLPHLGRNSHVRVVQNKPCA